MCCGNCACLHWHPCFVLYHHPLQVVLLRLQQFCSIERTSSAGVAARLPFFVPPPGHNRRLLFRFLFHKVLSDPATSCAISIFGLQVCWICVVEIRFAVMVFASVVMVLYLLSTHPVSLTISAICSWKGRWAEQTFLAHCDNLTLNRQNKIAVAIG